MSGKRYGDLPIGHIPSCFASRTVARRSLLVAFADYIAAFPDCSFQSLKFAACADADPKADAASRSAAATGHGIRSNRMLPSEGSCGDTHESRL